MLPYAIIPLLRFVSSPKVMGELAMAAPLKALYWATCALIVGANTALSIMQVPRAVLKDELCGRLFIGESLALIPSSLASNPPAHRSACAHSPFRRQPVAVGL